MSRVSKKRVPQIQWSTYDTHHKQTVSQYASMRKLLQKKEWNDQFLSMPRAPQIEPLDIYEQIELAHGLNKALCLLTNLQQFTLRSLYGLTPDRDPKTLTEVAQKVGLSKAYIATVRNKALRKLRHHTRLKFLERGTR